MADGDVTPGELSRRLGDVTGRLEQMAVNLDATYVRREVYLVEHEILRVEVASIRERSVWLFRTIVTALVLAGTSALVAWIQLGHH